jgi:threonine synthase
MNAYYARELSCIRCGTPHAEEAAFGGCSRCRANGVPSNLAPIYHVSENGLPVSPDQPGIFRYRQLLPLAEDDEPVSLGEGGTPLLPLHRLGREVGLHNLWLKDESRNPTWSYKDRLAAAAVTKARADGAHTVVVSTTGNHGAAVAAYAAAAGLRCVALTLRSVPDTMRTLMQAYGADVVAYERPTDRWTVMQAAVAERGWIPMSGFSNPPIGSNPYGVDGYKSLAFEIVEQLGRAPDVVVVPVAYGDGLAGIFRGFTELRNLTVIEDIPRLVVAETFGPYGQALRSGQDVTGSVPVRASAAFSIATPVGTYQALRAVRDSSGTAVAVPSDDDIMDMQLRLATTEGLYLEASSVVSLVVAAELANTRWLQPNSLVVTIGTSTGLKDVGSTTRRLPPVPAAEPTLAALDEALARPSTPLPGGR